MVGRDGFPVTIVIPSFPLQLNYASISIHITKKLYFVVFNAILSLQISNFLIIIFNLSIKVLDTRVTFGVIKQNQNQCSKFIDLQLTMYNCDMCEFKALRNES